MIGYILAGGKGTRLAEMTQHKIPKPLVKMNGIPIIEHCILQLKKYNVCDITISVGHLAEQIMEYLGDGERLGVRISYLKEEQPLDSGGALYLMKSKVEDDLIIINADNIFDVDLERMLKFHKKNKSYASLLVHPNTHPQDGDIFILDKEERIIDISLKNTQRGVYSNKVNAGICILNKKCFDYIKDEPLILNLEKDIIASFIKLNLPVYAYLSSEYIKDVGTVERFLKTAEDLKNNIVQSKNLRNKQKCVFLDRDGVINAYTPYIKSADDIELLPNVAEAIKLFNESDYLVIVISNQPVIARGDCEENEVIKMHNVIETELVKTGAYINDFFYCPHHPDAGFEGEVKALKIKCSCRKPQIGLFLKAQEKYNIDFENSYMIGDANVDIQAGINAGIKTIRVKSALKQEVQVESLYECYDLFDAVKLILKK